MVSLEARKMEIFCKASSNGTEHRVTGGCLGKHHYPHLVTVPVRPALLCWALDPAEGTQVRRKPLVTYPKPLTPFFLLCCKLNAVQMSRGWEHLVLPR